MSVARSEEVISNNFDAQSSSEARKGITIRAQTRHLGSLGPNIVCLFGYFSSFFPLFCCCCCGAFSTVS